MDSVTNEVIETRYKAWGEVRYTTPSKTLPTRNTFTGQYSYVSDDATDLGSSGFGLMFYNARWYDSSLGRFAQADSIVPGGSQGLDRYAYVNNSPLNYVDPSGHCAIDDDPDECFVPGKKYSPADFLDFTGYSFWEKQALKKLYNEGGPNAVHGVDYILETGVHITVGAGPKSLGAWFNEGSNTLIINSELAGNFNSNQTLSNWSLSLIIHEARHLEQGTELAHSKFGEMEAWQIQFDVREHLGDTLSDIDTNIKNAQTLEVFTTLIQNHYQTYWNWFYKTPLDGYITFGLYTYPDYPDWCWGGCDYGKPWWQRINFP